MENRMPNPCTPAEYHVHKNVATWIIIGSLYPELNLVEIIPKNSS